MLHHDPPGLQPLLDARNPHRQRDNDPIGGRLGILRRVARTRRDRTVERFLYAGRHRDINVGTVALPAGKMWVLQGLSREFRG